MRSFLSRQASPGTAISLVALFVALSGTAVALPGKNRVDSNDPKRGSIGTRAIANNSVRSGDIRTNNVRTSDINNGSVTGDDVDEGTLGKVPSASSADSATSATTASSAGNANTLGGASLNSIGKGRDAFDESCDPNSNAFVDCLGPTIAVTRPSKILIQTTGAWFSGGAAASGGQCLLQENDVTISGQSANDRVSGNAGNDRVAGKSGNDDLNGDEGDDLVSGGTGNDDVTGGPSDDGKDRLFGGTGNDRLFGGVQDADQCDGGPGTDIREQLTCENGKSIEGEIDSDI